MDPTTKPGAGEPPHEGWRNRDYDETEETAAPGRFWLQATFAVLMALLLVGMLWGSVIQPLLQ